MVVFAGDGAMAMIDKNNGVSAKLKTMKVFEGTTSFLSLRSNSSSRSSAYKEFENEL
jgi:hypothetical protein